MTSKSAISIEECLYIAHERF